jgi:amidase
MDIIFQDATDQLTALAERRISARELLEASVRRTDRLGLQLNAVVSRDLDNASRDAQLIDDRRARGETLGRLAGLPMTVKDALDVAGLPASAGRKTLLERTARDAVVVARVRQKGAVIWGKTNVPVDAADWQTYNPVYGTTNNPWNTDRTPGGSSGGSAAALSAGLTALEIGADIAGSLRVPASFCGVYAHKPTYGLVSQRGLVPPPDFAADLDLAVVGPMARSARDLRLLMDIIADRPLGTDGVEIKLQGLKVGLWLDEPSFIIDQEVKTAIRNFADRLAGTGAIVELISSPVDAEALVRTYLTLLLPLSKENAPFAERLVYEILRGPALLALSLGAKPLSWAQNVVGATARHREWLQANERRAKLAVDVQDVFTRYDILIAPVAPVPAFAHDHGPFLLRKLQGSDGRRFSYLALLNWIALATTFGLPATAIPVGLSRQGLPVGVQIIGPHGRDCRTLAVARAIEDQLGGFREPSIGRV